LGFHAWHQCAGSSANHPQQNRIEFRQWQSKDRYRDS